MVLATGCSFKVRLCFFSSAFRRPVVFSPLTPFDIRGYNKKALIRCNNYSSSKRHIPRYLAPRLQTHHPELKRNKFRMILWLYEGYQLIEGCALLLGNIIYNNFFIVSLLFFYYILCRRKI